MSTGSLLRDQRFRSFFASTTVSQFGDRISELAFPLIAVLVLDATPGQVAVLTALVWLPNLASIFLGAWIDRQPRKRRLLVVADLSRAALLATVPLAYALDGVTLLQLYAVALLTGAFASLFNTTYPAFFVQLVPREEFLAANSTLSASRSVSFIAGPAVGGGLIQLLTAPVAVLADAVSFVVSAVFLGRIRDVPAAPVDTDLDADTSGNTPRGIWHRSGEGLRFIVRDPVLRASLGCATTVNFFTFIASALLVLFASRSLQLSSGLIGLALGVGAFGGLVGAVLAPALTRRFGIGAMSAVGAVVFPASIALTAVAGGPLWSRVGLLALSEFFSGVGVMLFDVNLNSVMATVIPDGLRSRVVGAYSAVNYGVRPVGALAGGALGTWLGLRPALWVAAVGGSLCVLWLLPSPIARARTLADLEPVGQSSGRSSSA